MAAAAAAFVAATAAVAAVAAVAVVVVLAGSRAVGRVIVTMAPLEVLDNIIDSLSNTDSRLWLWLFFWTLLLGFLALFLKDEVEILNAIHGFIFGVHERVEFNSGGGNDRNDM